MYIHIFPISVRTVGVLAVTLGLGDSCFANLHIYDDQRLCAGWGDRACCLAPVHTKWSVASLYVEKLNRFSTLCLSAQKVLQMTPGGSQALPEDS